MTDEQWVWVFANMSLDNDEKLEHMCEKCVDRSTSGEYCVVCGEHLDMRTRNGLLDNVNINFDMAKFEKCAGIVKEDSEHDIYNDMSIIDQIRTNLTDIGIDVDS